MAVPNTVMRPAPERAEVLSKAVVRAAEHLELTNKELGEIVGLSQATVSRLRNGGYKLEEGSKPFECAQIFARLFRGLDAITGSDDTSSRIWLRNDNTALQGKPIEMIRTIRGLVDVVNYVDSRRAVI
jgi:hypothetical protein